MLTNLLATLRGVVTLSLMTLNVVLWFIPIIITAFLKIIIPIPPVRNQLTLLMTWFGEFWVYSNNVIFKVMLSLQWDIRNDTQLQRNEWYLVVANHQSWVDILVLQKALTGHIPFLKFFIKQSLIWVPFLGQAWWAMDMPFMKRYSREFLTKHPELRGQDLETTRKACARFRKVPTTMFNFVEGTRFTAEKHANSASPYRHLLPPRSGGLAFALGSMGDIFHRMLNVTIVYPEGSCSLWDFCCGRVKKIVVQISEQPLHSWLSEGDYANDEAYRERFKLWLTETWRNKDSEFERLTKNAKKTGNPG